MRFVLVKTIGLVAAVWLIATLTYMALYVLPGDPAVLVLGTEGDPARLESLRQELGLHQPLHARYLQWLGDLVRLEFGTSIRYARPVGDLIAAALPITLMLAMLAVAAALTLAVPLGLYTAIGHLNPLRVAISLAAHLGMAVPSFWLGILLIQWLAVDKGLLPSAGFRTPGEEGWAAALGSLVLPVLTLALPRAAILTRMVRASMAGVLQEDYMRTAHSKGLPKAQVYVRHGLRNAALNISTTAAIQLTQLLAGTIVVEQVFALPGLGRLLLAAVLQRDLPLVQGLVVIGAAMIVLFHYIFDVLLSLMDPRIRFD